MASSRRQLPPFDWDAIKAAWEEVAKTHGVEPRCVTRDMMRAAGHDTCFSVREAQRRRGARSFREAKDQLFPPPVPAPIYPGGHHVTGVSTLVDSDGTIRAQWIKTREEQVQREELLRQLLADLPTIVPPRKGPSQRPATQGREDVLAVYPMGDPHIGMLAWHGDAEEDFDLEKAERQLTAAARFLTRAGEGTKHAVIINLGDFFHTDDQSNTTRKAGHQLDVDSRYAKIARAGLHIMVAMVEFALGAHEQVRVINSCGNHDSHTAMWLSVAMDAHFRNEPRVSVDLSPAKFHYIRWGKCLVGVTHGDQTKPNDLEGIMAYDRAADWSETEHRYWFCGHIHHRRVLDYRNCVVEYFRTLAPRDAYAQSHGYRGRRDMQKILLSAEYGEVSRVVADHRLIAGLMEEQQ